MKSKYIYTILILTNFVTICLLVRATISIQLWESHASIEAAHSGMLQAENHFRIGKLIEYRLVVTDEADPIVIKPVEFNGPFLVLDHHGYNFPLVYRLLLTQSPTIYLGNVFVNAHNREMSNMYHNPQKYEKLRKLEIEWWEKKKAQRTDSKMKE